LTNAGLLQLAEYFRAHDASGWDKLARVALGFFKEGDKFQAGSKFSAAHASQPVGAVLLPGLWGRMLGMATGIDAREQGSSQEFTPSNGASPSFWSFMAAGAFKILERERGVTTPARTRPLPVPDPRDPDQVKPIPPPPIPTPGRGSGGIAVLVLVAIAVLALGRK
jgi:hypothetical protein